MKWHFLRFGIPLLAVLAALLLGELFFRGYFSVTQNYDVEMWRYARFLKMSVSDARSHVHRPDASAWIMGAEVSINSHGLRDRDYGYEKPMEVTRILIIGDSVTFGFGIPAEDTYAKIIERRLNESGTGKYEVINAGVGNYNTEQELAYFTAEGFRYHPDLVLLGWYINDAEATQKYPETFLTQHSIVYVFLRSMYTTLRALIEPGRDYGEYYRSLYTHERWSAYQKTLQAFAQAVEKSGARLSVVLLPELHSLDPYPFADIHKEVAAAFAESGHQVVDVAPAFEGVRPSDVWVARDDTHPNSVGHALIAEYMLRNLNFHL